MSLFRNVAAAAAFGEVLALGGGAPVPVRSETTIERAPPPQWTTAAIGGCGILGARVTNNGRAVKFSILNGVPDVAHPVDPRYNDGSVRSVYTITSSQAPNQTTVGDRAPLDDFSGRPASNVTYVPAGDLAEGANIVFVDGQNFTTGQPEVPQGGSRHCGGAFVDMHNGRVVGATAIDG